MPSKFTKSPEPTGTFLPEYSVEGSMVFTPTGTPYFQYVHLGQLLVFTMRGEGVTSGTASDRILFSLPVTCHPDAMDEDYPAFLAYINDGGTELGGKAVLTQSHRAECGVERYDGGNFCIGTVKFLVSGFYWTESDATFTRQQLEEDVRQLSIRVSMLEKAGREIRG